MSAADVKARVSPPFPHFTPDGAALSPRFSGPMRNMKPKIVQAALVSAASHGRVRFPSGTADASAGAPSAPQMLPGTPNLLTDVGPRAATAVAAAAAANN